MANKFEGMFFVYCLDKNGYKIGDMNRVTDADHLQTCVNTLCAETKSTEAHYNKVYMCFDGYLFQGDYCGTMKPDNQ